MWVVGRVVWNEWVMEWVSVCGVCVCVLWFIRLVLYDLCMQTMCVRAYLYTWSFDQSVPHSTNIQTYLVVCVCIQWGTSTLESNNESCLYSGWLMKEDRTFLFLHSDVCVHFSCFPVPNLTWKSNLSVCCAHFDALSDQIQLTALSWTHTGQDTFQKNGIVLASAYASLGLLCMKEDIWSLQRLCLDRVVVVAWWRWWWWRWWWFNFLW